MSAAVARDVNLSILLTSTELLNASNAVMHLIRMARAVLCSEKHSIISSVLVSPDLNYCALIGWQDLQRLRVIPASFPRVTDVASCFSTFRNKILSAFPSVFFR